MKKNISLFLGAVLLVLLLATLPLRDLLETLNQRVAGMGWPGMVLFVALYVIATVLLLPGSVLTLGAGFAFGLLPGMALVSVGSTLGAAAAFGVSRRLGRERVLARIGKAENVAALDRMVGAEGWKIVALLRLSPVFPFVALNYLLGLSSIRFRDYLWASWAGMLPGTLLYVYLGHAAKTGLESAASGQTDSLRLLYTGLGLAATAAATFLITRLARKAMRSHTLPETP